MVADVLYCKLKLKFSGSYAGLVLNAFSSLQDVVRYRTLR